MNNQRDTDQAESKTHTVDAEQDRARIKRRAIKGAAHEIASRPGPGRDQLAILPRDNYLALDFVRDNRWI